uniref:NADH-ubiquinone oxidoreductase chain 3 n=1 Tax=Polyplacotoma mediterranea TaxID=2283839 RepID=A0A481YK18_9METZ|nr:NADH dehydrogenase subunit 3 [Polyplacotoma mediterranea]QBK82182.1 NADH dehydrogenase subunit 3 [Polyplacotoma mediterranea]
MNPEFKTIFYIIPLGICLILLLIFIASAFGYSRVGQSRPDPEKNSIYECGFDPFGKIRTPFAIKFALVGILFMIFDIEISLLIPWTIVFNQLDSFSTWIVYIFVLILTIGLAYEWLKGGLEWE